MITQYIPVEEVSADDGIMLLSAEQSTDYGSISADIQNLVANSVSVLDLYVLMQTGEYEYTALIKNLANKEVEEITITRDSTNYSSRYRVNREIVSDFDYSVSNEYYVYSNCGFGKSLDIPSYEGIRTYGLTGITVLVFFMVVFKGALFKCLRNKK